MIKSEASDNKLLNRLILLGFCTALAIVSAVILGRFFDFYLSSNDDIMLHNLMTGAYTGTPESQLVFIMHPLGALLSALYKASGTFDVYEIFASYGHYACLVLCAYRVGSVFSKKAWRFLISFLTFFLMLVIDVNYLYAYQYTVFAGVLAATGILWVLTSERADIWNTVVATLLLMVSMWLRKEVFFMSLPFWGVGLLFKVFENGFIWEKTGKQIAKWWLLPCVLLLMVVLSSVDEKLAYKGEDWKAFKAYNEARTDVFDYDGFPDYYKNLDLYSSLEIDESEYIGLKQYDIELFPDVDTDTLLALCGRQKEILKDWEQYYSVPNKIIRDTLTYFFNVNTGVYIYIFMAVSLASLIVLLVKKMYPALFASLLTCAGAVVMTAYLLHKGRFPDRVSFPLFLIAIVSIVIMTVVSLKDCSFGKAWKASGLFVFAVALVILSFVRFKDAGANQKIMKSASSDWMEINEYMASHSDKTFLLDTGIYANSSERMFTGIDVESDNSFKLSSWIAGSLLREKRVKKVFDSNSVSLTGPDVAYILPEGIETEWLSNVLGSDLESTDRFVTSNGRVYVIYDVTDRE